MRVADACVEYFYPVVFGRSAAKYARTVRGGRGPSLQAGGEIPPAARR